MGRKRVIFYISNLWLHSQMKWRHPSLGSATTPQKTHPVLGCPWSRLSSYPFAEGTIIFLPKGEKSSGSACFVQKQMINGEIAITMNIWPKVLCIPRNSPKTLYTEIFKICLFLCYWNMLFKTCDTWRGEYELPTSEQLLQVILNSVYKHIGGQCWRVSVTMSLRSPESGSEQLRVSGFLLICNYE